MDDNEPKQKSEWNIFLTSVATFGELYHDVLVVYAAILNHEEEAVAVLKGNTRAMLSILTPYLENEEKNKIEKMIKDAWNKKDEIHLIHVFEDNILKKAFDLGFLPKKVEELSNFEKLKRDML